MGLLCVNFLKDILEPAIVLLQDGVLCATRSSARLNTLSSTCMSSLNSVCTSCKGASPFGEHTGMSCEQSRLYSVGKWNSKIIITCTCMHYVQDSQIKHVTLIWLRLKLTVLYTQVHAVHRY